MTVTLCVIAAKSCSTISLWTGSKTARQPGADYWSWRAGYTCCAIPGGAGVGTLVLADDDDVHLSNLQRQILFTTEDIDRPKSQVSHQRLTQLNPDIQLMALQQRLTGETLKDAVAQADVVLDCTDNMATRQEINAACVALNTPLITASAVGFGGQLMVLTPPWEQGCYRCLWPDNQEPERNCRTAGVVGPVVGVMGTLQAWKPLSY